MTTKKKALRPPTARPRSAPKKRPAGPARPARLRAPKATIAPVFATKLRALDDELGAVLPRLEPGADGKVDEEAIHDVRVAIRRLRTLLKVARLVYGRRVADAWCGSASRWSIASPASSATKKCSSRRSRSSCPRRPRRRITRRSRPGRSAACCASAACAQQVRTELATGDPGAGAGHAFTGVVLLPIKASRDEDVHGFARSCVDRARRRVEKMRDVPTTDGVGLHELRIAYKELRYATEIFADVLPADLAALAGPAARFQKRLGEVHDVDMALDVAARSRLEPALAARIARALTALRRDRVAKYVGEMQPALASAPPPNVSLPGETKPTVAAKKKPAARPKRAPRG